MIERSVGTPELMIENRGDTRTDDREQRAHQDRRQRTDGTPVLVIERTEGTPGLMIERTEGTPGLMIERTEGTPGLMTERTEGTPGLMIEPRGHQG